MIIRNTSYEYAMFKKRQTELSGIFDRAAIVMNQLNLKHHVETLKRLSNKTQNDTFKIQVVGTFKNGKSTFINAFLGEEILPAYALPCTAVINEVKYGTKKRAVLYFKNPLPKVLPKELSEVTLKHLKRFGMKNIPPLEIPYEKIEEYVVIPIGKDPQEMLLESPYEKVELYWPLDLLKNGVEIIDSPGLNEHATRTKVTMDYLSKADAILFVLNATSICTKEEMGFIKENLNAHGFVNPFFVVNRFDLIPEKEHIQIKKYAYAKLKEYTTFGEKGIFFLSARNALDGKTEKNTSKLLQSGLLELENDVSEYLIKQKGRIKLLQPTRELKRIIYHEALFKIIPNQKAMLAQSVDDIRKKFNSVQPVFNKLKVKNNQDNQHINLKIMQSKQSYREIVDEYISSLLNDIPIWINSYTPETKTGIVPQKKKIEALIFEIASFVSMKLDASKKHWETHTLAPLIKTTTENVFADIKISLKKIFDVLSKIQANFCGNNDINGEKHIQDMFESIALQEYKFLVSDTGTNKFALELAKNANKSTTLYVAESLTSVSVNSSVLKNLLSNSTDTVVQAKRLIMNAVIGNLSEIRLFLADNLENQICKKFNSISHAISDAVNNEISQCESQIKITISQIEQGSNKIAERYKFLNKNESDIKIIGMELDKMTFDID